MEDSCQTYQEPSGDASNHNKTKKRADDKITLVQDGGWGWVVVFGSFVIHAIIDGCSYSFGVIFARLIEYFGSKRSDTAWIGSLFLAVPLLCGPIASTVSNKLGARRTTILGGLIICTGLVCSSFCTSLTALYFTYGIIAGLGVSFPYLVSTCVISTYFTEKRALAVGISECGAGVGTFLLSPTLRYLISVYDWRGAVLILGGIVCNIIVCGCLFREIPFKKENDNRNGLNGVDVEKTTKGTSCCKSLKNHLPRISLLSNWKFAVFCLVNFVLFLWYDVPYMFTVDRAKQVGETEKEASYLVAIIGIIHMIGNIVYGYLGDRKWVNPSILYSVSLCLFGISVLLMPYFTQFLPLAILASFFGLFSAATEALVPSIIVNSICVSQFTDAYGILMFLQGVGNLIGPPIAGWLFDISGSYDNSFLVAGSCIIIAGTLFYLVSCYEVAKKKLCKREDDRCLTDDIEISTIIGK